MSDLGQTRDWEQRCKAAEADLAEARQEATELSTRLAGYGLPPSRDELEARVARLEADALCAASIIDWCIGFGGTSDNMKWGDLLVARLREARAALASGGEGT